MGTNIALHKKVKFSPQPGYPLTTDPGDALQFTDGKLANPDKKMWMQKQAVGWRSSRSAMITVDLGKVQPIAGVGLHMAAGTSGNVLWPRVIQIFLSDDGKTYHAMGSLLALAPAPVINEPFQTHWFKTHAYKAHGRYVKLIVEPNEMYIFADEIAVYAGKPEWLDHPLPGPPITDVATYFQKHKVRRLASRRITEDMQKVRSGIVTSSLPAEHKKRLLNRLTSLRQHLKADPAAADPDQGKHLLPFNDLQRHVLAVWGQFLSASDDAPLVARPANLWNFMTWISQPSAPKNASNTVTVWAMRHEARSAAVNFTNATSQAMRVMLSMKGLNAQAGLLRVYSVGWTDTVQGEVIADALMTVQPVNGIYQISIPAGVTRQVWLVFKPTAAGQYAGQLIVQAGNGPSASLPLRVNVFKLNFPAHPHLHVGGFDYTNSTTRGVTNANRHKIVSLLRRFDVDTPWATRVVLPFGQYDQQGNMIKSPDMSRFNQWLKLWPNAARYAVYVAVGRKINGLEVGTKAFKKAVGQWAEFIAQYAQSKGIAPSHILLHFRDEAFTNKEYQLAAAWADDAKNSGLTMWADPVPPDPQTIPKNFLAAYQVFCFNRKKVMDHLSAYMQLSNQLTHEGKSVEIYGTKGMMKLQDPYAYNLLQAWRVWSLGGNASSFWSFTANGHGLSDWKPYQATGSEPFTPLFLDSISATPAKQLAAIRAGVEDYEYLYMLKQTLLNSKKLNLSQSIIHHGRLLLASAVETVLTNPGIGGKYDNLAWSHPKNRSIANRMRIKIGKWLVKAQHRITK